jgi:hypothetical protein
MKLNGGRLKSARAADGSSGPVDHSGGHRYAHGADSHGGHEPMFGDQNGCPKHNDWPPALFLPIAEQNSDREEYPRQGEMYVAEKLFRRTW